MIEIKITGLDALAESIAVLASALAIGKDPKNPLLQKDVPDIKEVVTEKAKTVIEDTEVVTEDPETVTATFTLDELRKAFTEKNTPENRPKLKKIITDLGVRKITDLAPEQFATAMAALQEV